MMQRLTLAALVACLIAGGSTVTLAQSPSPSPDVAGQRVVVSEHDFAVTFPGDWTVDLRTVPISDGSGLPGPDVHAAILVNAYVPDAFHGCRVSLWQGVDMVPAEFVSWQTSLGQEQMDVMAIRLPVGEAFRYALITGQPTEPDIEVFTFGLSGDILQLTCLGDAPPDDRWLSIAERIEFMPAEE